MDTIEHFNGIQKDKTRSIFLILLIIICIITYMRYK